MKILKRISFIIYAILIFLVLTSCNKSRELGTTFYFSSYKTFERVPFDVFLEDEYFDKPASSYNQKLSTASACLALAGGSSVKGTDYKNTSRNIKYFFEVTHFTNFMSNSYGESEPTKESFGVYCAMKQYKDYTIIGVGVRGFGYLSEWASNFKLGNNNHYAEGFYEASTIYLDTVKDFITKNNIKGKIKIWSAGFSRGAAVVNLAAGRLDESVINNTNILSENVTYTKDDIYAYCFEPPAGKIATIENEKVYEKGENFNNIHCIVNVNDVVVYAAPLGLGFVRYGIDYYLPDIMTSNNYEKEVDNCKSIYNNLPNVATYGGYKIDQFYIENENYTNFTLGQFLIKIINHLSNTIGTRDEYYSKFQNIFMELAGILMSKGNKDAIIDFGISLGKRLLLDDVNEVLIKDVLYNKSRFFSDLKPILENTLSSSKFDLNVDDFINLLKGLVPIMIGLLGNSDTSVIIASLSNLNNIKLLASGHIPELLLSFMVSMDTNYGFAEIELPKSYYKLVIKDNPNILLETKEEVLVEKNYTSLAKENNYETTTYLLDSRSTYNLTALDADISYELYEISGLYLNPHLVSSNNLKSGSKVTL